MKPFIIIIHLIFVLTLSPVVNGQVDQEKKLRIVIFGAHPDDPAKDTDSGKESALSLHE